MNPKQPGNVKLLPIVFHLMCVQSGDGVNGQKSMVKMVQVKDQVHQVKVELDSAKQVPIAHHVPHIAPI